MSQLHSYRVIGALGVGHIIFALCDLTVEAFSSQQAVAVARDALLRDPDSAMDWIEGPQVKRLGPVLFPSFLEGHDEPQT